MISILIIDDHAVARLGIRQALRGEIREAVFGEARTAKEALTQLAKRPWSIVILDISLPDRDGFEILQLILKKQPSMKVLVFSLHAESQYLTRAKELGARGYVSKDATLDALLRGVRDVLAGKKHFKRAVANLWGPHPSHLQITEKQPKVLSAREREILLALATGRSVGEIATSLNLSFKTISTYKRRVMNKLQLDSIAGLVRYAIDHKLS